MVPDANALQAQNAALQQRLRDVRKRRIKVERQKTLLLTAQRELEEYENELQLQQQSALAAYQSSRLQTKQTQHLLNIAQQWNVLSDCFHISYRGAFGTINGLRLGVEAPRIDDVSAAALFADQQAQQQPPPPPPVHHRFFGGVGSVDYSAAAPSSNQPPPQQQQQQPRVPWSEINGALGHVVLLLATLARRCPDVIRYRHILVPAGSTSKIGLRPRGSTSDTTMTPPLYNLFYDEGQFSFFGRRNFNLALQGLLGCVQDAVLACTRRDRTIAVPHPIVCEPNSSSSSDAAAAEGWTIGGLPVVYNGANADGGGVTWTKAMKYLLTDLKHLLTFRALVLWDPIPPASS